MNKANAWAGAIATALLLTACSGTTEVEQGDLVGARIGGDFTLVNQDGNPVHWSDFSGQYRLVYFGYTYCPDVCPIDLSKIMAGFRQLEKSDPEIAAKIQPILISVDPQRDTPEILKQYVAAFHPRLIGLTGPVDEIERVKRAFVVMSSKDGDPDATQDYLVSHSRTPYLFGPQGDPIALVPVDDVTTDADEAAPGIMRDFLKKWVQ